LAGDATPESSQRLHGASKEDEVTRDRCSIVLLNDCLLK